MIENSSTSVRFYYYILIGKEWCCSILRKYTDMIPYQKWGDGMTSSEKIKWKEENCNEHVGGSSKALCTGIVICNVYLIPLYSHNIHLHQYLYHMMLSIYNSYSNNCI